MTGEAQHDGQKYGIAGNTIFLHENVTLMEKLANRDFSTFGGEMTMFAPGAVKQICKHIILHLTHF